MQIRNHRKFLTVTLLLGSTAIVAPSSSASQASAPRGVDDLSTSQQSRYAAQTSKGEVTLDVHPRWEDRTLLVDIRANTHSVALDSVDLTAQVRLIIGADSIAPDEAGGLSGHHASATLEFVLDSPPAEFIIEIRGIPDVSLRILTWPVGDRIEPVRDDPPPLRERNRS